MSVNKELGSASSRDVVISKHHSVAKVLGPSSNDNVFVFRRRVYLEENGEK